MLKIKLITLIILGGLLTLTLRELTVTILAPLSSSAIQLQSQSDIFKIEYNHRPIVNGLVKISSIPAISLQIYNYENKTGSVISPTKGSLYDSNQEYIISVSYLGRNLETFTIKTPATITSPSAGKIESVIANDYPLAAYLPYKTEEIIVDYIGPKKLRLRTSLDKSEAISVTREHSRQFYVDIQDHEFVIGPK